MSIQQKIIRNKSYKDINPQVCGMEKCQPGHSYGPAVRSYFLLHFVVSGKGRFQTRSGSYDLKKGDVFIIRPYDVNFYQADEKDPWTYIWIGFTSEVILPPVITSKDTVYAPFLSDIFFDCINGEDVTQNGRGYEAFLCSKIWELISKLEESPARSAEISESYVRSAIDIMESEYSSGITVSSIVDRLHLNRSYFTTLFKEVTNRSPGQYLMSLRMKKAAELLRKMGFNVSVTALSVGYPDLFTFSRAFKKYYGVSPREYVEKYEKNN